MMLIYFVVPMMGWILVGVPFALAMPSQRLVGFHPVIAVLIGAAAGALSMLLLFKKVLHAGFPDLGKTMPYFVLAAVIGSASSYVYRLLLLRFSKRLDRPNA